jgi:hypothetical protein
MPHRRCRSRAACCSSGSPWSGRPHPAARRAFAGRLVRLQHDSAFRWVEPMARRPSSSEAQIGGDGVVLFELAKQDSGSTAHGTALRGVTFLEEDRMSLGDSETYYSCAPWAPATARQARRAQWRTSKHAVHLLVRRGNGRRIRPRARSASGSVAASTSRSIAVWGRVLLRLRSAASAWRTPI